MRVTKIGDELTVTYYKYGDQVFKRFKGTVAHIYQNSCCINLPEINNLPAELNNKIVISKKRLKGFCEAPSKHDTDSFKDLIQEVVKLNNYGYGWAEISRRLGVTPAKVDAVRRFKYMSAKPTYRLRLTRGDTTWYITSSHFLNQHGVWASQLKGEGWLVEKGLWYFGDILDKRQIFNVRSKNIWTDLYELDKK